MAESPSFAALCFVKRGEVVEDLPHIRMLGTEGLLSDRQRAFVERLRRVVTALGIVKRCQGQERSCDIQIVIADSILNVRLYSGSASS